jgi:hypothetical protein
MSELTEAADRLAAALAIALFDAHPTYANTTGWRGGIGGQAMTTGCSMIDPPPDADWLSLGFGLLSEPLRDYMRARHWEAEQLNAAKADLSARLKALL